MYCYSMCCNSLSFAVAYYTIRFYRHIWEEFNGIVGPGNLCVNYYIYQTCIMAVLDIMLCTLI